MPRVEWSFFLPAQDHKQIKWLMAYSQARHTALGRIIGSVFFVTLAISSVGTQISAYLFPSFILALWVTAWFLSLFFRPKVEAHRLLPSTVSAGGYCVYKVMVRNACRRPLRNIAVVEPMLPYGIYPALHHPENRNTIDWLDAGDQAAVTLVMHVPRRGVYELPAPVVGCSFPSGVLRAVTKLKSIQRFVVYPKLINPKDLPADLAQRYQHGGQSLSTRQGGSHEFACTREYRHGDRIRDVHWASSARATRLIVKEYLEEYFTRVGLFVDTELKRFEKHKCFEARIGLCAGTASRLIRDNYRVDLFLSDPRHETLQTGRGADHLDRLLELLAVIEGDLTVDFAAAFHQLERQTNELSLLIVFLKDWDPTRQAFVRQLEQLNINIQAVIVRDRPTTLPVQDGHVSVVTMDMLDNEP